MNLDKMIKEEPSHSDIITVPGKTPEFEIFKSECLDYEDFEPYEHDIKIETDPLCMSNNSHVDFSVDNRIDQDFRHSSNSSITAKSKRNVTATELKIAKPKLEIVNTIRLDGKEISTQHIERKIGQWKKKIWSCPICHNEFGMSILFIKHWNAAHKEDTMTICDFDCGRRRKGLKFLKIKETDLKIENSNSKIIQSNGNTTVPNKNIDVKIEGKYACPICSNLFTELSDMINHIDTHKESKQFCCSVCNLYLKTENALKKHKQAHGQENRKRKGIKEYPLSKQSYNEKPISCPICEIAFVETIPFMKHLKDEHNVDNTKTCPICNMDLRGVKVGSLAVHMWDHSIGKDPSHTIHRPTKKLSTFVDYIDSNDEIAAFKY